MKPSAGDFIFPKSLPEKRHMRFEVFPGCSQLVFFSLLLATMTINNAFKSTRSDSGSLYAVLNFMIEN